jgi:hypothetical protein
MDALYKIVVYFLPTTIGAWAVVTQGQSEPSAAAAVKRSSGQTSIPSSVLS